MEDTVEKNHLQAVARAGPAFRAVAGVAFAILGFAVLAGCDKATKPRPVKYNIYIGGSHYPHGVYRGYLYVLDVESLSVLDSIPDFPMIRDAVVSSDGLQAFLGIDYLHPWSYDLVKIDLATGEQVGRYQNNLCAFGLNLVDSGRALVVGFPCNQVIDPVTLAMLRNAPDSLSLGYGPESGTKVSAISKEAPTRVCMFETRTGTVSGLYVPHLLSGTPLEAIYTTRLHPDGRRVLVIGLRSSLYNSWFVIGDLETGETLLEYQLVYPFGEIAISSDGALAAVSDPSRRMIWDTRMTLDVFDLKTMKHLKQFVQGVEGFRYSGQVRFLPSDDRIVSAPEASAYSSGSLQLINVNTMIVEKTTWLPFDGTTIGALAVGRRPQ